MRSPSSKSSSKASAISKALVTPKESKITLSAEGRVVDLSVKNIGKGTVWMPVGHDPKKSKSVPIVATKIGPSASIEFLKTPVKKVTVKERAAAPEAVPSEADVLSWPPARVLKYLTDSGELLPTKYGDLTGGYDTNLYILNRDQAAKLSIPLPTFSGSIGVDEMQKVLVKTNIRYKLFTIGSVEIRVGAGLRWITDVVVKKGTANLNFAFLAASAELKQATARVLMKATGITTKAILDNLNVPSDLNVENYVKMTLSYDKAVSLLADEMPIDAQVVGVQGSTSLAIDDETRIAMLVSWAIKSISERRTLKNAMDNCPFKDTASLDVIADYYNRRLGTIDPIAQPPDWQASKAKDLMAGFKDKIRL